MQVHALPLWPGVSLTLVNEADGWRFASWSSHAFKVIQPPPEEDQALRFATVEDAAAHFRALCPRDASQ